MSISPVKKRCSVCRTKVPKLFRRSAGQGKFKFTIYTCNEKRCREYALSLAKLHSEKRMAQAVLLRMGV